MAIRAKRLPAVFLLTLFLARASAEECLVIADDFSLDSIAFFREGVIAYYEEAGYCVNVVDVPASRAVRMLDNKQADGLLFRSKQHLEATLRGVVSSQENIGHTFDAIASLKSAGRGSGIASFAGTYIAAYRSAIPHVEQLLDELNVHLVPISEGDYKNALLMLEHQRIHGVLLDDLIIAKLRAQGLLSDQTFQISDPILPRSLHLVLREEHKDKIPSLDAAIRRIGPIR